MKKLLFATSLACGLLSAQANLFQYNVSFTSAGEANASPGTGFGTVIYDNVAHSLALSATFSGLLGTTTASHIHSPTAVAGTGNTGVATTTPTFAIFPLGVTSGTFANTLDLTQVSSFNPAYVTAHGGTLAQAEADLTASFASGQAYWNIHSTFGPGGEIRGFLVAVPEPSSLALLGLGGMSILARVRSKRAATKS